MHHFLDFEKHISVLEGKIEELKHLASGDGLNIGSDSILFHAGAKYVKGKVKTNGGRVLAITSMGDSVKEAVDKSYKTIKNIKFEKMNYRKDIGFDL